MGDEKSSPQSAVRLALWLSFLAFLLVVVVFHSKIAEITFGEKGMSAKMISQDVNSLSTQARQSAQDGLDQRVHQLEEQAKSHPQEAPQPAPGSETQFSNAVYQQAQPAVLANIAGYWSASDASTFQVMQNGANVVLQGYNSGIRYVIGSGQLLGSNLTLQTTNLLGRPGTLALQLSQDGHQLIGQYSDNTTGESMPIQIYR